MQIIEQADELKGIEKALTDWLAAKPPADRDVSVSEMRAYEQAGEMLARNYLPPLIDTLKTLKDWN